MRQIVFVVEKPPFLHVKIPDDSRRGVDGCDRQAERPRPGYDRRLLFRLPRDVANQRNHVLEKLNIVVGEADRYARLVATSFKRGPSRKNAHRLCAETLEDIVDGAPEPISIGQQENHRGDTPRHAQHGEHGLAKVVAHGAKGLVEQIAMHAIPCAEPPPVPTWRLAAPDTDRRPPRQSRGQRWPAPRWPAPTLADRTREGKARWTGPPSRPRQSPCRSRHCAG